MTNVCLDGRVRRDGRIIWPGRDPAGFDAHSHHRDLLQPSDPGAFRRMAHDNEFTLVALRKYSEETPPLAERRPLGSWHGPRLPPGRYTN